MQACDDSSTANLTASLALNCEEPDLTECSDDGADKYSEVVEKVGSKTSSMLADIDRETSEMNGITNSGDQDLPFSGTDTYSEQCVPDPAVNTNTDLDEGSVMDDAEIDDVSQSEDNEEQTVSDTALTIAESPTNAPETLRESDEGPSDEQLESSKNSVSNDLEDGELEDGELEDESDDDGETSKVVPREGSSSHEEKDASSQEQSARQREISHEERVKSRDSLRRRQSSPSYEDSLMEDDQAVYVSGASPQHMSAGSSYRHERGDGRYDSFAARSPSPRHKRRRVGDLEHRPRSNAICSYYMQGKCQRGRLCPFSHDATPPKKMELCKFYLMNCCAKKQKCLYMHKSFPCKFFHTGAECYEDAKCKFSHQPLVDTTRSILLKHLETAPVEILGDFPRMGRSEALQMFEIASTKRANNEMPNFTFPNLEICRKRHLATEPLDGYSSDSERGARVRRRRKRHHSRSASPRTTRPDQLERRSREDDKSSVTDSTENADDAWTDQQSGGQDGGPSETAADCGEKSGRDRAAPPDTTGAVRRAARTGDRVTGERTSSRDYTELEHGGRRERRRSRHDSSTSHRRRRDHGDRRELRGSRRHRERSLTGQDRGDDDDRSDRHSSRSGDRPAHSRSAARRDSRSRVECRDKERWDRAGGGGDVGRGEDGAGRKGADYRTENRPAPAARRRRGLLKTPEPEEVLIKQRLLDCSRYGYNDSMYHGYQLAQAPLHHRRDMSAAASAAGGAAGGVGGAGGGNCDMSTPYNNRDQAVLTAAANATAASVTDQCDTVTDDSGAQSGADRLGSSVALCRSSPHDPAAADGRGPQTSPANMPLHQRHLYRRIQQQQKDADCSDGKPLSSELTPQPSDEEGGGAAYNDWYSSDDEQTPILDNVLKNISNVGAVKKTEAAAGEHTVSPLVSQLFTTLRKATTLAAAQHRTEDSGDGNCVTATGNDTENSADSQLVPGDRWSAARSDSAADTADGTVGQYGDTGGSPRAVSRADPRSQSAGHAARNRSLSAAAAAFYNSGTASDVATGWQQQSGSDLTSVSGPTAPPNVTGLGVGDNGAHYSPASPQRRGWPEATEELDIVAPAIKTDSSQHQLPFKLVDFHPCVEVDASCTTNTPMVWKLVVVVVVSARDYSLSQHRVSEAVARIDPRLRLGARAKSGSLETVAPLSAKLVAKNAATLNSQPVQKDPRRVNAASSHSHQSAACAPPAGLVPGVAGGVLGAAGAVSGIHVPPPPLASHCLNLPPPAPAASSSLANTLGSGARNMGAGLLPTPPLAMFAGEPLAATLSALAGPSLTGFQRPALLPEPSTADSQFHGSVNVPLAMSHHLPHHHQLQQQQQQQQQQQLDIRDPRLSSRTPFSQNY